MTLFPCYFSYRYSSFIHIDSNSFLRYTQTKVHYGTRKCLFCCCWCCETSFFFRMCVCVITVLFSFHILLFWFAIWCSNFFFFTFFSLWVHLVDESLQSVASRQASMSTCVVLCVTCDDGILRVKLPFLLISSFPVVCCRGSA